MCSAAEDVQCKRWCAVQIRHIFSTNQAHLQYKSGTSSVQAKDVQYKQVNNHVLVRGGRGGALLKNTIQ